MASMQGIQSCSLYTGEADTTAELVKEEPQQENFEKPLNGSGDVPSDELVQVIDSYVYRCSSKTTHS